jgi:hypothetical protein
MAMPSSMWLTGTRAWSSLATNSRTRRRRWCAGRRPQAAGGDSSPLAAQLAVGGLEQIIPLGRNTDGDTGEQVIAQIAGSASCYWTAVLLSTDAVDRDRQGQDWDRPVRHRARSRSGARP